VRCVYKTYVYTTVDYPYYSYIFKLLICLDSVGAGIYVTRSGGSSLSTSFRNNSIVLSYASYSYSSTRMFFYCCSNSTSYVGSIIGLDGRSHSTGFSRFSVYRNDYGCIYMHNSGYSNYLRSSEQGIYTCSIPDVRGRNMNVHVGIYRHDYSSKSYHVSFLNVLEDVCKHKKQNFFGASLNLHQ